MNKNLAPALAKAYNKIEALSRTLKNKKMRKLFQHLAHDLAWGIEQIDDHIASLETEINDLETQLGYIDDEALMQEKVEDWMERYPGEFEDSA